MRKDMLPRGAISIVVATVVLASLSASPAVAGKARGGAGDTWNAFLADRPKLLETLAPAFVDCFKRRDSLIDPLSPIFHGCLDWHSAVHAAYSHHVLFRRTGKKEYFDLAQDQIAPHDISLVAAEQVYEMAKAPEQPLTENPYGFGWFLVLAREREESADLTDFRAMADYAAEQMMAWFQGRLDEGDADQFILNRAHPNYSWSLINLDVWARYTNDKVILESVRNAMQPLLNPDLDALCPIDTDMSDKATGFQPACLMRLAAVGHVLGPEARRWVSKRLPNDLHIDPITAPANCHAGGLNFTRAFALFQLFKIMGNTDYRDNYAELIRYHVSRPDLYIGPNYLGDPDYLCYSHWVAQVGVRAISLSYER